MSTEASAVWNECLRVIEQHVNEQSFSTWFSPINPVKLEGSSLTIQVPSQLPSSMHPAFAATYAFLPPVVTPPRANGTQQPQLSDTGDEL